jgi:hypothetical protein
MNGLLCTSVLALRTIRLCAVGFSGHFVEDAFFDESCYQIPDTNNLKEERFILAHGFSWFSPWLLGLIALGQNIMTG